MIYLGVDVVINCLRLVSPTYTIVKRFNVYMLIDSHGLTFPFASNTIKILAFLHSL